MPNSLKATASVRAHASQDEAHGVRSVQAGCGLEEDVHGRAMRRACGFETQPHRGVVARHLADFEMRVPRRQKHGPRFEARALGRFAHGKRPGFVESAGEQGQEPFANIPRPNLVQNEIYRQMEENTVRHARGGPVTASIPQQIEELARLRDQGIISAEEFEAKKADLLRRM